jgi:hypothetical protein
VDRYLVHDEVTIHDLAAVAHNRYVTARQLASAGRQLAAWLLGRRLRHRPPARLRGPAAGCLAAWPAP